MFNNRQWNEWCDAPPSPHMSGCVEGEYIDGHGEIEYAALNLYHYHDERGSVWGFSAGTSHEGDYKTLHPKFYRWRFVGPNVPMPGLQCKSIIVWRFHDAPGELRCLSEHGGDEDWLVLSPPDMGYISWLEGSSFSGCSVSEHTISDGRIVYIGAHA